MNLIASVVLLGLVLWLALGFLSALLALIELVLGALYGMAAMNRPEEARADRLAERKLARTLHEWIPPQAPVQSGWERFVERESRIRKQARSKAPDA